MKWPATSWKAGSKLTKPSLMAAVLLPILVGSLVFFLKELYPRLATLVLDDKYGVIDWSLSKSVIQKIINYSSLHAFWKTTIEGLREINWLKWVLLFLPFIVIFVSLKEKFLNMKNLIAHLKADNEAKNNYIKSQKKNNMELQERVEVLRVERQRLLESYRKLAAAEREADLGLKRNLSDSVLEEKSQIDKPEIKPRPKTEDGKKTLVKSCPTQKSRSALRMKIDISNKEKEEDEHIKKLRQYKTKSKYALKRELEEYAQKNCPIKTKVREDRSKKWEEEKPILHTVSAQNTREEGLKKREEASRPHNTSAQVSVSQETRRDLTKRKDEAIEPPSINQPMSVQDCLYKDLSFEKLNMESLPAKGLADLRTATDELVAKLEVSGMGRVTSYTEVFKKKVHVPSTGKPPEITIEGKQRWCF